MNDLNQNSQTKDLDEIKKFSSYNEQNQPEKNNKKLKTLIAILLLLIILLISAIGYGIYYFINYEPIVEETYADLDAKLGIMPGMTLAEIQQRLNQVVEEGMVNVSINPDPVFEDGSSKGNIRIENIAGNHYDYVVTITLDDTEEEVYKSGVISPGYYVETAKLTKELPKGDYSATARFKVYVQDTKEIISNVSVNITLHILN